MKKIILTVDTSSWWLSMSIYKEKKIYTKTAEVEDHSDALIKFLDELLKKSKTTLKDLTHIGVNIGPGSFTGLRVGLSFVKTIALNFKLDIICINSFDGLLYGFIKNYSWYSDKILVLFPSVKDEFYFCEYRFLNESKFKAKNIKYAKLEDIKKNFLAHKFIVPENSKNIINNEKNFYFVKFNSETIINIFLEEKKYLYKLTSPKKLFPMYVRHTYY
ncbi:MAG: tRNA (adenosine(37)-N6)-threonylcarbamoyltransferase complex dimerization subunit type 1 TsaB [Endomicrobiia bacterium]